MLSPDGDRAGINAQLTAPKRALMDRVVRPGSSVDDEALVIMRVMNSPCCLAEVNKCHAVIHIHAFTSE